MKARLLPLLLLPAGLGLFAAEPAASDSGMVWVEENDPAAADIRRVGEQAMDAVGRTFLVEVRRETAASVAAAVDKLHLKDYKPPASAAGQPVITAVRHTSLRLRNPANAPDAADLSALDLIKQKLDNGDDVPHLLVQKLTTPGQPVEWRVYQPLGLAKQCVVCHGPADEIEPAVSAALKAKYPGDKATDYSTGDWRGIFRISLLSAADAPKK